jgi:hypothetical protein
MTLIQFAALHPGLRLSLFLPGDAVIQCGHNARSVWLPCGAGDPMTYFPTLDSFTWDILQFPKG